VSWLIVTGGAHRRGGQDRANLELIRYLAQQDGNDVHVVAHEVANEVSSLGGVRVHLVPRLLGSTVLGERLLERSARRIHRTLGESVIVVANGGNYPLAEANWVHSLHAAWPVRDEGAPVIRRALNRAKKRDARIRERRALGAARVLIANSAKTAQDLSSALGLDPQKIVTIPFGSDPLDPSELSSGETLQLGFVGALGWDRNKGLDIALEALRLLVTSGEECSLTVAGPGTVTPWRRMAERLGLASRVTFLGPIEDVPGLLRKVDLLVSPVRYEAYGLAIQEALVAGVPALVSKTAGIASLIEASLPELVVTDNEDPKGWALAIRRAATDLRKLRARVKSVGEGIARRSWKEMAAEIVGEIELRRRLRGR
jgi:glycosyltransferase involved in cell wall biosynthesis